MPRPLLIVGASARAAAQSARRAGLAPIAVDLFADRDLSSVAPTTAIRDYPDEFVAAAMRIDPCDWAYVGGLENHPAIVEQISERHRLLGVDGPTLRQVRDPLRLQRTLETAGFCSPRLRLPASPSPPPRETTEEVETHDARDDHDAIAAGRWLEKPLRSGGGQGVHFVSPSSHLGARPASGRYWQQFVDGPSLGAVFVGNRRGAQLLGVTRQLVGLDWAGASEFGYVGSLGPWPLAHATRRELDAIGDCLAREFRLAGLFCVDAVVADERPWTIEVNPRYSASVEILERATGVVAFAAHVAACDGRTQASPPLAPRRLLPSDETPCGAWHGKAVIYARRPLRIDAAQVALLERENAEHAWPRRADIPRVGAHVPPGAPIATAFAHGDDEAETLIRLRQAAAELFSDLD